MICYVTYVIDVCVVFMVVLGLYVLCLVSMFCECVSSVFLIGVLTKDKKKVMFSKNVDY